MRYLLLCLFAPLLIAPQLQGDPFENADWLRDPRTAGFPVADLYARGSQPVPEVATPKNMHTLYRGTFDAPEKPVRAILHITGDDYFKAYINGHFAVQGPEPTYPFAHAYFTLDVTDYLQQGKNLLAIHGYYQGLRNRVWNSADNRSGFMATLELEYAQQGRQVFKSDSTWRVFPLEAATTEAIFGYQTQFAENVDLRKIPVGWKGLDFDDSAWLSPVLERQDHVLVPSDIPPLQRTRKDPVARETRGDGVLFYDLGKEVVAHTAFRVRGKAGQELVVRHGEELNEDGTVRYKMRATRCDYEETFILTGGEDQYETYDYKGFRYIEVLNAPEDFEIWTVARHYPVPADSGTFTSSDELTNQIWEICRNGIVMGSQGGYLDCPTREKGQYLGDTVIAARAHFWITGDSRLPGKAVKDFAMSRAIHSGLMAVAPGSFMQEIADHSLQYPLLVERYYLHSGDRALSQAIVEEVFPGLLAYFATFENESGLLVGMNKPEKWLLIDWPGNLRDGYEYDPSVAAGNTLLNAFYFGALETAARMATEFGLDGAAYQQRADKVKAAMVAQMINPDTGLFVDYPGSTHSSLHANAIPLYFGITEGVNTDAQWKLIESKGLSCGVYIAAYVIEACFKQGQGDLAWKLITSKDEHSWHEMLKHGATACLEAWGPDQKGNSSWCHPWSSSPIYLITEYVLGLRPAAPGFSRILFAPAKIKNLPAMQFEAVLPVGKVTVSYDPKDGYAITAPAGVPLEEQIPAMGEANVSKAARSVTADEGEAIRTAHGWNERVGDGLGVWVHVDTQQFHIFQGDQQTWQVTCATAEKGTGQVEGSMQTPLGWHTIDEKIGDGAPWGQVFRSRQATKEIWKPGILPDEDLVLTRLIWLRGLEAGHNAGKNAAGELVDSKQRYIYIHGTNGEDRIGEPSSHGCIRLLNDDVIKAFDLLPEGTPVLITEGGAGSAGE